MCITLDENMYNNPSICGFVTPMVVANAHLLKIWNKIYQV